MKKLMSLVAVGALVFSLGAAEKAKPENLLEKPEGNPLEDFETEKESAAAVSRQESAMWPACIAFYNLPDSPDVVGIRFTIPFSTKHDSVTGFDLGFWGVCRYFEGFQINIFRNAAVESCSGMQIGLYNSVGREDLGGAQIGLWNEACSMNGLQVGLINIAGYARGFQVGLINRSETMYGFQVGAINIIRDAEVPFFPVLNIGF